MRHPFEPFRIKVTEPISLTTLEERKAILKRAHHNLFFIRSREVVVDLLTDSGTGAMSQDQWSALIRADEAYAGSRSFEAFEEAVRAFTGKRLVIPVHQGRAAEKIIAASLLEPGTVAIANTFFDTTRANFEHVGAQVVDLPTPEAADLASEYPFKGNIDLEALEEWLRRGKVRLVVMTLTNNTGGGQPASLENVREAARLAHRHGALFMLDACRIAENAFLIKQREPGQQNRSVREILRDLFAEADLAFMSAKKDGLSNTGGFIVTDDEKLAEKMRHFLILWEGFPTYGGMARRDLEAVAVGLREVQDEAYLAYRVGQVAYLAHRFRELGAPVLWPPGGHAVYVEASRLFPQIPRDAFPGHALAVALYLEGGVRTVEIGSLMFGKKARWELVRFAIPRRMYTQSHLDYVAEVLREVMAKKELVQGFRITYEPPFLRHFLAHLEPVRNWVDRWT